MKLTPVFIDFETFWSVTHSLTKMPSTKYVMHKETEIISVSLKIGDGPTTVVFGESAIRVLLSTVDWATSMVIGHNMAGFDSCILAWRFNIKPAMWCCTLAMARPTYAKLCGLSLGSLVTYLNLGHKDNTALVNTKGKHLKDFLPSELEAMEIYNAEDTELCYRLFKHLIKTFPRKELQHIDMTTRMLVAPKFFLDQALLQKTLIEEREAKTEALLELDEMLESTQERVMRRLEGGATAEEFVRSTLASATKFGEILTARGVEIPMKVSPSNPAKMTPALAKTDQAFTDLQDHPDPVVAAAVRCRLAVKSTLLETRIEALLGAAQCVQGRVPVPLKYAGADTTGRWSGEQYNLQNLPRINPFKPRRSDALRMALCAKPGYMVAVADLSQIEMRVNHFLWQVTASMDMYRLDPEADLYRAFAAARYKLSPELITKMQRQLAKVAQLGLGFGAAALTFQRVVRLMSEGELSITLEEAESIVEDWRTQYRKIKQGWRTCHDVLPYIREGTSVPIDPWGMCVTEKNAIRLPSGRRIQYPALRQVHGTDGKREWAYGEGRHTTRIYAGKITENLVQALARDVLADNILQMRKDTGLVPSLLVHDEVSYIVPEASATDTLAHIQGLMRTSPTWWKELVTWSEGDVADRYGLAH